jgi:hypothetical protein
MAEKVMTAPLAIIKTLDNIEIGKCKNIRVTESYTRADVRGLGKLTADEKPVTAFNGTFSAAFYTINMKKFGSIDSSKLGLNRNTGDVTTFVNTLILNETPFNICIYKKKALVTDATTGIVTSAGEEEFAIINNIFIDSNSFDISEGNVSGQDLSGTYTEPILFAVQ